MADESPWLLISSRDEGDPAERFALFRAKVPANWHCRLPIADESLRDSTRPNAELTIGDGRQLLVITVHSFPYEKIDQRIPPAAQVQRWQRQFEQIDCQEMTITPCARGGFVGLKLEAYGSLKGLPTGVIAWSMQLAAPHYLAIHAREQNLQRRRQRSSDYTIKAIGPPDTLQHHRLEIEAFAASFEFIEEIPSR
jgi:hypothetical protein